jgi:hypothetical protein
MTKASEYIVKRVDKETYELWYDDKRLATLTREEAWPVMTGQVSPSVIVRNRTDNAITTQERNNDS